MHIGLKSLDTSLQAREVHHCVLVHARGKPDPHSVTFASGLAADVQHTLAVVDLQPGEVEARSDALAKTLAGRGSLRLVFVHPIPSREVRVAASRIAERLQCTILVADGEPVHTGDGGLFVPSENGTGWAAFRPGRGMQHESQRFPKPAWEFSTFPRPWAISEHTSVEPLPSGVWVRGSSRADSLTGGRQLLIRQLPSHFEIMNVVLGCPGGPPVPLGDVARFWETVLPTARGRVRFVHFGPISTPDGRAYGQELADRLGQQVVVYAGIPLETVGDFQPPTVVGLHKQGTTESRPFVSELMYFPRGDEQTAPPPALFGLRQPVPDVPEIATGVYEYAADAVLEVVQSGLWMRPPVLPTDVDDVRNLPAAPGRFAIYYDRSTPSTEERMRVLAEDMLWRLDSATRGTFQVTPADDPWPVLLQGEDDTWSLAVEATEPLAVPRAQAPDHAGAVLEPEGEAPGQAGEAAKQRRNQVARRGRELRNKVRRLVTESTPQPTETGQTTRQPAPTEAAGPPHAQRESADTAATTPSSSAPDAPVAAQATGTQPQTAHPDLRNGAAPPHPHATGEAIPAEPTDPSGTPSGVASPRAGETNPHAMDAPPLQPTPPQPAAPRDPAGPNTSESAAPFEPAHGRPGDPLPPDPAPVPSAGIPGAPPAAQTVPTSAAPPAPAPEAAPPAPEAAPPAPETAPTAPTTAPAAPASPVTGAPAPAAPAPRTTPAPASGARPNTPRIRLESAAPGGPAPEPDRVPGTPPVQEQPPAPSDPTAPEPLAAVPTAQPMGSDTMSNGSDNPLNTGTGSSTNTATTPAPPARASGDFGPLVQPVPKAAACAAPGKRDLTREREWVRRTFNSQFHTVSGSVSRIMSQTPGLRGASRAGAGEALTDLVAVKLYLSGDSGQVDRTVRSATVGPHVPLARCVASGLLRLPSYRGPSLMRVSATAAERCWFREGRLVTEWGFCAARTNVEAASVGNTDFLIWSMTARRTSPLDPDRPDQVVFVPGTSFKVLRLDEDGVRPSVLMRELLPSEIGEDGKVDVARVPLDEIALGGLEQAAKIVASVKDAGAAEPAPGSGWPPGLLSTHRAASPAPHKSRRSKGATS